jgi:hypothetical protein
MSRPIPDMKGPMNQLPLARRNLMSSPPLAARDPMDQPLPAGEDPMRQLQPAASCPMGRSWQLPAGSCRRESIGMRA